ncbi:gamma-glutamyltransferase [Hyphobacterium sp. HN65]|uniref:Glutathione hydrolase proenzyme n=1 Tax=Hyphobacterium lacteum TaxID=3116575 RepID=A0ABU7LNH6_9PROT|nr:gamma-glutamyltransferase [Hyphobacterium sp. HN65]MEE2525476.1 gamma-glutamyltransferase [Hyphobacterium sp. HN65]
MIRYLVISLFAFTTACSSLPDVGLADFHLPFRGEAVAQESGPAMVASANPHATEAGLEALRNGGNAIDAAIAIQTTLSLVEPQSSGIGGGAFMLYYDAASGETTVYDGREMAPASTHEDHWLDENGEPLPFLTAWTSGRAVGVPGVIAMLALAHDDHGARAWSDNFTFAEALAEDGFAISPRMQGFMVRVGQMRDVSTTPDMQAYFFDEEGNAWPVGHILRNPEYANTLRHIAADWRYFYEGPLAFDIVDAVNASPIPGNMSVEDLANYRPAIRQPLCRDYRDYEICSAPPPASGGVIVNEIMGMLENFDMASTGPDTVEGWRRFIEASRLAYADRDEYIGDPAFTDIPVETLLSDEYIDARAALIDRDTAIPDVSAGEAGMPGTSHFTVVDHQGNIVSMTTTVEFLFGSNRMAGGFFLNNQLTDFNFRARNENGELTANAPAAGKRPRSSLSPSIVFDENGEFVLTTGSPGGASIIAYTAKTLVGMLDWGLTPQEAIELPNVVARGNVVRLEETFPAEIATQLEALGFTLDANRSENSGIHSIRRLEDGTLIGGADPRREGVVGELTPPSAE